MADFFFDTSALAKRYIIEIGSNWVTNVCAPSSNNFIFIAEITTVELTAAITRRSRGGTLTVAHATTALNQFDADLLNEYFVLEVDSAILTEAKGLAKIHGLRGYDAVQLAVATAFNREQVAVGLPIITLVSADIELLNAAQTEGLLTENPNNYP